MHWSRDATDLFVAADVDGGGHQEILIANNSNGYIGLLKWNGSALVPVSASNENTNLLNWEELDDRLEAIIYHCRLEVFEELHQEYKRRIQETKRKQFLSNFLQKNPGIQHKAGVPLGGTFIIVYHENPKPVAAFEYASTRDAIVSPRAFSKSSATASSLTASLVKRNIIRDVLTHTGIESTISVEDRAAATPLVNSQIDNSEMSGILARINANSQLATNPDIRLLLDMAVSQAPGLKFSNPYAEERKADGIIQETINKLADGIVIADFFLPYQCSCDCDTVQFVLPRIIPTFSVQISCTNVDGYAQATITPKGGLPPYSVKIDGGNYVPLAESFLLIQGAHSLMIRDADNIESDPQPLRVPTQLALGEENYINDFDKKTYQVFLPVIGGTAPYTATSGTLDSAHVFTSEIIESGAELIATITDSAACKVTKNFTHEVLRPTFTVQLTCTNSDGNAQVAITPQSGVASYSVKINDGNYVNLGEPFILAQGDYSLTIKDSVGSESLPQPLTVPAQLSLGDPVFQCNDNFTTYSATILIAGGTMPYQVNGVQIDGQSYTSEQIKSGQPVSIKVIDKNHCTAGATATHTCVAPCNLPCNGIALQRGYRFWLPKPGGELSYDTLKISVRQFVLDIATGEQINITTDVQTILTKFLPASSLNTNFNDTVVKCLNVINDLIAKKTGNPDFLKLVYQSDPNLPDMTGILLIEYFECLSFKFDLVSAFPHPNISGEFRTLYEPVSTSFMGLISATEGMQIPAINGLKIDKCNPQTKPTMLCQEPIDLVLKIGSSTDLKNNVTITVTPNGTEVPVSYLCELPHGFPLMSMSPIATFKFNLSNFPVKQVRITAFTQNGCWISRNHNIAIG